MEALEAVILTIITASTPLLLAATGELVTERSGVLNLGVEGMMIMGAVCSFAAAYTTGSALLGVLVGLYAGVATSLLFAFLTQTLMTSQVATGLSLTLLGLGLSGLIGEGVHGAARGEARIDLHPLAHRHPLHRTDPVRSGHPGLHLTRADRGGQLRAVSHPDRTRHQRGGQQSPFRPCARLWRSQGSLRLHRLRRRLLRVSRRVPWRSPTPRSGSRA